MALGTNESGFVGGAATGAATGAALGSVGGPPGAIAGAGIGALVGGVLGYMQADDQRRAQKRAEKEAERARIKLIMQEFGRKQQADQSTFAAATRNAPNTGAAIGVSSGGIPPVASGASNTAGTF